MGRTAATLHAARDEIVRAVPAAVVDCAAGDARDPQQLRRALEQARTLGPVTTAISVVGGSLLKPLALCEESDLLRQFSRNTVSAFSVIREATPFLAAAGGGAIVCISSVAARIPYPNMTPYSAAKAALEGLVRGAALELAPLGIRVNSVRAGLIRSNATRDHLDHNREIIAAHPDVLPLGREGETDDVGAAVAFLASPHASWITGQSFAVDAARS